jgi:hypothetical protein
MEYVEKLRHAIRTTHGCDSVYVRTARVREVSQGRIVRELAVMVFEVKGHPKARQCYAWSDTDDAGAEHFTVVLELPPVDSPEKAIKVVLTPEAEK